MDKSFLNMDERFKGIEGEMKYDFNSSLWSDAEKMLNDTALDQAFVEAASVSAFASGANFENVQDAFLDDAFTEASASSINTYDPKFFNEFKADESALHQSDSFVEAAALSSVEYQAQYWEAADAALKSEGLHHEYKSEYWKVAEKMLLKNERKFFFYKWGSVAIGLLLISFIGINYNSGSLMSDAEVISVNEGQESFSDFDQTHQAQTNKKATDLNGLSSIEDVENVESPIVVNQIDNVNLTNENVGDSKITSGSIVSSEKVSNNSFPEDLSSGSVLENEVDENIDLAEQQEHIVKIKKDLSYDLNIAPLNDGINDTKIEVKSIKIEPRNELSLKVGKGIGNSFGNSLGKISPRNSVALSYVFTPIKSLKRFGFGIDIGAYHMNLAKFEYERNYSVHHNYGNVDHYWYKMVYKDLIFLSTNLNTYVNVGKSSRIKLGLGLDYLMTSRVGSEYKNSLTEGVTIVQDSWGLGDVMNMSDLTIGLGYEYQLNSKFSFLVDSKMGFKDKINNDFMNGDRINKDLSIQLGIKYNIFTK
jgi:hypothetical protein